MIGLIIMEIMSINIINFRNKEDLNLEMDENFCSSENIDNIETTTDKKDNLKEEKKLEKIDKEKNKNNVNERKSSMFVQNNKNHVLVNLSSPDLKAAKRKNQFLELSPIKKKQSMFVKKTEK